jgi:hypothetical protein
VPTQMTGKSPLTQTTEPPLRRRRRPTALKKGSGAETRTQLFTESDRI